MPNLKIIADVDCHLLIDGEFVRDVKHSRLEKIYLERGEYYVEFDSVIGNLSRHEIIRIDFDIVLTVNFLSKILEDPALYGELDLIPVQDGNGLYGYEEKKTKILIHAYQYRKASDFENGRAIVKDTMGLEAVIDKSGKKIIDFGEYTAIQRYPHGFEVFKNHKAGFANLDGQLKVECRYSNCCSIDTTHIWCTERKNFSSHDYLFDDSGKLKYEAEEILALGIGAKNAAPFLIKKGSSYGVLDQFLNILIPIKYNSVETIYSNHNHGDPLWGTRYYGDSFGIYNFNNNVPWQTENLEDIIELKVISTDRYDELITTILISYKRPFYKDNELCIKTKTMKQYLITGDNLKIDLSEYRVGDFYDGFARVYLDGFRFYITANGKKLCENKYEYGGRFYWGTAVVKTKDGFGVIDKVGNEIIPCSFHWIYDGNDEDSSIEEENAHISFYYITVFDEKGNEGVYDRKGNEVVAIQEGQYVSYDGKKIHVTIGTKTTVITPEAE